MPPILWMASCVTWTTVCMAVGSLPVFSDQAVVRCYPGRYTAAANGAASIRGLGNNCPCFSGNQSTYLIGHKDLIRRVKIGEEPIRFIEWRNMAQTPTQTNWKYLWRKPGSVYLQLFVNGRVAARTLYGRYMSAEDPRTIEEIAADWNLPIEAVKEAIAYCQSDPPEIRLDFQREEALIEASGMNDP